MGKLYLTADMHFGHANIIKYENRPFANEDDMDGMIIKNWNYLSDYIDRAMLASLDDNDNPTKATRELSKLYDQLYSNVD